MKRYKLVDHDSGEVYFTGTLPEVKHFWWTLLISNTEVGGYQLKKVKEGEPCRLKL